MKISFVAVISGALTLAGCASIGPLTPQAGGVAVSELVATVQCELASAFYRSGSPDTKLAKFYARTHLDLSVTNVVNTAPGITVSPALAMGELTVPFGAAASNTAVRKTMVEFDTHMAGLAPPTGGASSCLPVSGLPQSQGGLGLSDWLKTIAQTLDATEGLSLITVQYDAQFTLERSANGQISFKLAGVTLTTGKSEPKQTNANHLLVTLAAEPSAGKGDGGKTPEGVDRRLTNYTFLALDPDQTRAPVQ